MGCVCRASSLRIFVQSLTGLQVAHRPVPRPARLHSTTFAATRLSQTYLTRRSFHAAAASLRSSSSPEILELPELEDGDHVGQQEVQERVQEQVQEQVQHKKDKTSPAIISTSADDLERAKNEGVILDFSPESLDLLLNGDAESVPEKAAKNDDDTSTGSKKPKRSKSEPSEEAAQETQEKEEKTKWVPRRPHWQLQKEALKAKFPEGWKPRKKLSPDAMEGMRALHQQFPDQYPLPVLSQKFEISPEAVRRILRSKWRPNAEEEEARQQRWFERGKQIWTHKAALGVKPPRKWRREGIVRDPIWNVKRGPRTEWPYMPRRSSRPDDAADDDPRSPQEKLSENLV